MKAYFRERENHFHIRFVDRTHPDHSEFVQSFRKDKYTKKQVKEKIDHINTKIKFEDYNPWQARKNDKRRQRLSESLGVLIERFITENVDSGNWMEGTARNYRDHLSQILAGVGDRPARQLSESELQQWLTGLDVSLRTKYSYGRKANTFFKWLHENDYSPERWKIGLTRVEAKQLQNEDKIKYLTYNQLQRICRGYRWRVGIDRRIGYIKEGFDADKYPDIWQFMFWQMLRKSELPKITREDVDLNNNRVRIHGKGNKVEWIYIVPPAREILKRRLSRMESGRVFNIGPKSTKHYEKFVEACGLALGNDHDSGLHQLRHGGVTHYISLGKPVQFVSKLARHKSIRITLEIYADVLPDKVEDVFRDIEDQSVVD